MDEHAHGAGPAQRSVEIGVALFTAAFAVIVIIGSLQAGIDWGAEGPKAGFFPFYVGVVILGASVVNLVQVLLAPDSGLLFAEWAQLGKVASIAAPTVAYVALIPFAGIYVASALLIAVFMRWLGRYGWLQVLAVSISVPLVTFAIFEEWFLVPLPKGPLETMLGY